MYIDRIVIARLLKTRSGNVRRARQIEAEIHVKLWDSKDPVVILVRRYNDFLEEQWKQHHPGEQRKQHHKPNTGGKREIGKVLMVVGALITMSGCSMDTTVPAGFGQSVHNIGLINEQNQRTQLGGIAFVAGVILYCLDGKNGDS